VPSRTFCASSRSAADRVLQSRSALSSRNQQKNLFPSRQRDGGKASLRARPRHAEDQRASDRGETAPPSAPARARSVNTYARPSPHGNIRASRAHSLTCSADRMPAPWAADDPVGRAERPPHTTRQARDHPQRAAAHRAALPAKPAPPSCTNRAHNRAQRTAHTGGARAAHADARATATRTRTQHARVARQRSATHRAHFPSAAAACHNPHLTHARTHSPLPAHALGVAESSQS